MKKTTSQFKGVFTALVTPMKANGEIHLPKLERLVDNQIRKGIHGLIPLGSTGEFYALTPTEREQVIKTTLKAADGRVPVVAGVNAGSTREVVAYARQAEQLGCSGVMVAAPFYSLPRPDELFKHIKAVNNAIGIPMMIYNYPGRTGVDMTPEFLASLTALKNVRYVKESTGEMARMTTLMRLCGDRLGVFCGCDTLAIEALMMGTLGWVGGVANALPASHVKLYELTVEKRDYVAARKLFFDLLPTLELMEGGGKYTQWVKAACGLLGFAAGAPRQPLCAATKEECTQLRAALKLCEEGR
jgi:4-hydroxy-tetrahydrodipicolinate synthase